VTALYFAYGANMSRRVIAGRRGLAVVACERARLLGHRLTFGQRGFRYVEPAFATVIEAPGESVHGVLWTLAGPDELARLDRNESREYDRVEHDVVGETSGAVRAHLYRTRRPWEGLVPSRRYRDLLVSGAREHELPSDWIARLAGHPVSVLSIPRPILWLLDRVRGGH
jgi:gamma-glutamylcyclotransferase